MNTKTSKRYIISPWIFFILFFGFVTYKLVEYHVFPDHRVLWQAQRQYWSRTPVRGVRGVIRDTGGNYLASSVPASGFFIDPAYWSQSNAPALEGLISDNLFRRISGPLEGRYLRLMRTASAEVTEQIRALNLPGVFEDRVTRRVYHNGQLLSHVLGFSGADGSGQAGIELAWNSVLYRPSGYRIMIRQSGGRSLVTGEDAALTHTPSVTLTIDARIQYIVERHLNETASGHNAVWGAAICINPNTGAVLAMASWPTFNPNYREEIANQANTVNNVVGRVYEPGSTFKTIYMGIALEDGLVRRDEVFNANSATIRIADGTISEAFPRAMGRITPSDILVRSSNVGMAQIGMRSRAIDMYRTLLNWGFGQVSDIELGGVERGLVASPNAWWGVVPANISIGQGIGVTPLQLTVAMAAVVNGGQLLSPFIVQEAIDSRGDVIYRGRRQVVRNVLTEDTSRWLRTTMRDTVLHGTGRQTNSPITEIAVKTGTAQVAERGVYIAGRYVSSIIGFWPYNNPQYLMLIVIGEPSGRAVFGGEVAAPAFRRIVEDMAGVGIFDPQRGETL